MKISLKNPVFVGVVLSISIRQGLALKGFGYCLYDTKHKLPQIYIKFTQFEDNDGRKLPLKKNMTCQGAVIFEKKIILTCSTDLGDFPGNIAL